MINVGERLKYIRETYDLTQIEFANIINVSKSSISHYERNDWSIPMKHLITISDALNVSIDYMLGLTTKKIYKNTITGIQLNTMALHINEIYAELKLTNVALAKILNTSESTLRNYRKGKYLILTDFALQLALNYNYSVDWIIGKTDFKIRKKED